MPKKMSRDTHSSFAVRTQLDDEVLDLFHHTRPTRSALCRSVELRRDEPVVPAENRVGLDDGRDLAKDVVYDKSFVQSMLSVLPRLECGNEPK